jgi:hypothetical protein
LRRERATATIRWQGAGLGKHDDAAKAHVMHPC